MDFFKRNMAIVRITRITITLLATFSLCSGLPTRAADDYQFWPFVTKKMGSYRNLNLSIYAEPRYSTEDGRWSAYIFGPTLSYKRNPWLTFATAVKVLQVRSGDGFARIYRYEGQVGLDFKLAHRWRYQHRARLEILDRHGRPNNDRIRNRAQFSRPVSFGRINKVFFSNEYFFDTTHGEFDQNRFVPFGISMPLRKGQTLSLFYMYQHVRANSRDHHILGASLSF
ncbi:DUF2490 domain-containing protein [Sulfidibacter corallicola]|uniref:DUF2490 domain-containing protein n=1 Tax=Sulfidibacter corallicola TaxID=2818388 RepID=A0A8A4TK38_SULCO|nr:DUF2490 domain-containing protein [Sulfidibacter corallicola]QTD49188.1 DUF2490 domain-containing protein [Sulfidibacter corallicola]